MQTASIHPNVNAIEKVEPLPLFHFWVGLSIKKAHIENIRNLSTGSINVLQVIK